MTKEEIRDRYIATVDEHKTITRNLKLFEQEYIDSCQEFKLGQIVRWGDEVGIVYGIYPDKGNHALRYILKHVKKDSTSAKRDLTVGQGVFAHQLVRICGTCRKIMEPGEGVTIMDSRDVDYYHTNCLALEH